MAWRVVGWGWRGPCCFPRGQGALWVLLKQLHYAATLLLLFNGFVQSASHAAHQSTATAFCRVHHYNEAAVRNSTSYIYGSITCSIAKNAARVTACYMCPVSCKCAVPAGVCHELAVSMNSNAHSTGLDLFSHTTAQGHHAPVQPHITITFPLQPFLESKFSCLVPCPCRLLLHNCNATSGTHTRLGTASIRKCNLHHQWPHTCIARLTRNTATSLCPRWQCTQL
jgi:hypothetical protein